ncbi:S-layer family protein [Natranaerovirga pectinivora]|uniref:S-layer family protein n=1 Tax=Natranaerovirga pectinivora TaxID=682400 RepID=A0A4R3MK82_9FIRM|nr:S-layer homology domain-containing protein [Natranaerovirga pectinivora]TCT13986.1 S-layer family protein [Natranaerovirga pectinivora]
MKKKWMVGALTFVLASSIMTQPLNKLNYNIVQAQEVQFTGRDRALAIIENITFRDVADNHWAKEAIVRLGAIDIVKGYNEGNRKEYRPGGAVTNQEALAFILRILGLEEEAQKASEEIENEFATNEHVLSIWSKGYLQIAMELELITEEDFENALEPNQGELTEESFRREMPATREQVAQWLVKALNQVNPALIRPLYVQNRIFNYADWENTSSDKVPYVEAVIANNIMVGDNITFRPRAHLTRAEMAMIISNVDDILYDAMNIQRKSGVVDKIEVESQITSQNITRRKIYVRTDEGKIEIITYEERTNNRTLSIDVPVYNQGQVQGLGTLKENDSIEYLVDQGNTILYVLNKGAAATEKVQGVLQPLHNLENGFITIKTSNGNNVTYRLSESMYIGSRIKVGNQFVEKDRAPVGQSVVLDMQNNLIVGLDYDVITSDKEISGIVKSVSPNFGYITITDWYTGKDVIKNFYRNQMTVEKLMHYDNVSQSYINGAFKFNPLSSTIEAIEPGDIVYITLDDAGYISHISARTNYIVKYGKVLFINYNHGNSYNFTVEYEDGQLGYFEVNEPIIVQRGGNIVPSYEINAGDWVKMLVNQAVISPGHMEEKVKEINIDSYKNSITRVFKGQLSNNYNPGQRTLALINSEELSQIGWIDYRQSRNLEFNTRNLEVYYNGQQISFDEALHKYRGPNYTVYVAMEELPGREQICRISIFNNRDTILNKDHVIHTDGGQSFTLFGTVNPINVSPGTIIIRNGRLVEPSNIMSPDYAQVILNGQGRAAVVNITQEPGNDRITVSRGRIKEIEDRNTFTVSSQGMLMDMTWVYSPIERTYTINYETIIMDENGFVPFDQFRGYDENSQIEEVYTIISEGTHAKYVIKNPYSTEGVTGRIYDIGNGSIRINNVNVYNTTNKTWDVLSYQSNYGIINIEENSIILKNNKVITPAELKLGDNIRVLTTENLTTKLLQENSREVIGYIILVE